MNDTPTMNRLSLNSNGTTTVRTEAVAAAIAAELNRRGIASARVVPVTRYTVAVDDAEWDAAKKANTARIRASLEVR